MSEECQVDLSAEYDMELHIASVFIIATFSFLGTTIPLLFKKYFSTSSLIFQSSKLIGSGVILSTAFLHMLAPSFEFLNSPCAEIEYAALAGVCALIGVLFTLVIQLIASEMLSQLVSEESNQVNDGLKDYAFKNKQVEPVNPNKKSHDSQCLGDVNILEIGESSRQDNSCDGQHDRTSVKYIDSGHNHSHGGVISHSNRISAYLLEMGIAIHSVIIGVALGVAREEFISLFIALVFHQLFEGIGLSSVISEGEFKSKWMSLVLVVFCKFLRILIIFRHSFDSGWDCNRNWTSRDFE